MAIDPANTDAISIPDLETITLNVGSFFVASNADGNMGKFTASALSPFITGYVKLVGDTMTGKLIAPAMEISTLGQSVTTYNDLRYPVQHFVGAVGNPELNCSYNMDYNKPGLAGVHLYTNSAYPAIWTAHGPGGYYIQMANSGLTQTGFLRASVVGGSGYTDGIYNVGIGVIQNLTGTGTGANATVYITDGVVTNVIPGTGGVGYAVGDTFTIPAADIGGTGSGFVATITYIGNDIWVQDGLKYMLALSLNQQAGFGFISGSTYGDARVISRRLGTEANYAGYTSMFLEGHRVTGTAGDIHLNALSSGDNYLGEGGGNSYITDGGGITFINRNGGKAIFGVSSSQNAGVLFNNTYTVPVLPGSPVGRVLYSTGTVNATENNQQLIGFDFVNTFNDNGFTGIEKIEARFRDKVIMSSLTASLPVFSDANKNLVSNAITGTGSVVMSAAPTLTGTVTMSGGTLSLSNATSNFLLYGANGIANPTFTTRSVGTKAIWSPAIGGAAVDYATGIGTGGTLWNSVPTSAGSFVWYAGTTSIATLSGAGKLTATTLSISAMNTAPATAGAAGVLGEIRFVNGFIYVCVATNTWQRVAIATW